MPLTQRVKDNDIWWHLQTGKIITTTHSIPAVDPFSYSMTGKPWVPHEWLSEVIFWLGYDRFGFGGLVVVKSLVVLAVFFVVFLTARLIKGGHAATIATAVAAIVSVPFWAERPQLFGYLFLAILLWLIERFRRGSSLWPVIPLFTIWINMHGSWLIGFCVLLAAGVEFGWDAVRDGRTSDLRRYAVVLPLAVMALFINPSPLAFVAYPFQYLGATHHTDYISEWQSPSFHEPVFWAFAFVLVALPVLLRVSKAKSHPVQLAVVLGLMGASLFSLRHMPVFAIVAAPFLAKHIGSAMARLEGSSAAANEMRESPVMAWIILLLLPALILIRLPNNGPTPYQDLTKYPKASFDHLAAKPDGGKLLTCYDWGGYAIFRLWPKYHVFIDGRADLYGGDMIKRMKQLDMLKPGWRRELRKANPDVIVWPADRALSQALDLSPDWQREPSHRKNKVAAVFVPAKGRDSGAK